MKLQSKLTVAEQAALDQWRSACERFAHAERAHATAVIASREAKEQLKAAQAAVETAATQRRVAREALEKLLAGGLR